MKTHETLPAEKQRDTQQKESSHFVPQSLKARATNSFKIKQKVSTEGAETVWEASVPKFTRGAGGDPEQHQHSQAAEIGQQVIKPEQKLVQHSKGLEELAQSLFRKSRFILSGTKRSSWAWGRGRAVAQSTPGGATGAWSNARSPCSYTRPRPGIRCLQQLHRCPLVTSRVRGGRFPQAVCCGELPTQEHTKRLVLVPLNTKRDLALL